MAQNQLNQESQLRSHLSQFTGAGNNALLNAAQASPNSQMLVLLLVVLVGEEEEDAKGLREEARIALMATEPRRSLLALASANPTMHDDPSVSKSDSDSRPFSAPRFAFESILLGSSRGFATESLVPRNQDLDLSDLPATISATKNPTSKIVYDEHNHERYPPGDPSKRAFAYFVLTGGRFVYASLLRLLILKFVLSMSASKDVLALASLEVDLSSIEPGTTVTVKWRVSLCSSGGGPKKILILRTASISYPCGTRNLTLSG
uniref:Cytochrome b-c1 complex subunit Rieske transmembrane domain-containing protein n=1 Tax=Ananas comosus var. bracteatus TaxID=296719 RepID=A0A6V7NPA5_ANACO|nr:unnamed protein product [Ananas comosus var. bracteatus]